jgi:transcription antitermination factor NusG
MVISKKWYAIYTRPHWEKKIAGLLTNANISNYCPLNKVLRQWSDRKKVVYEPLFRSYVFVQIGENEITKVKEVTGGHHFVSWLNKPAIIKDEEIVAIKNFLNDHINVQLEKCAVNVQDVVRIVNGPLSRYEGNVVTVNNKKVRVSLPSLGYTLIAEVDKTNIELIKKFEGAETA